MWREIRADRIETEVMAGNLPGHGRPKPRHRPLRNEERAALTTALRYRTHAQMETKRATDLFWCHRKARRAELLEDAEEAVGIAIGGPAIAVEAPGFCTNEFANENTPPDAAPEPAPAEADRCTNEFEAPVTPPPEEPMGDTVTLLSTYRALKKQSVGDAWAWLNELTPEEMERVQAAIAGELGPRDGRARS